MYLYRMNTPDIVIRLATDGDIEAISRIYSRIHDAEESGATDIGWTRDIYPTRDTAVQALTRGDLYVMQRGGDVVASAIINHSQDESYSRGNWLAEPDADSILVLHTLTVDPDCGGNGLGRRFIDFYEALAHQKSCSSLRLDTQHINKRATNLYTRLGYRHAGTVTSSFFGIRIVTLHLFEKSLPN